MNLASRVHPDSNLRLRAAVEAAADGAPEVVDANVWVGRWCTVLPSMDGQGVGVLGNTED